MSIRLCPGICLFAILCLTESVRAGEVTATWTGDGTTNRWAEPANWDIGFVPNNNATDVYHVVIDGEPGEDVEVVFDIAPVHIQTLTINAGDTLTMAPPATLIVDGGLIDLAGLIQMNPLNASGSARMIFPEDCLIRGPGEIHMMGQPGRCFFSIDSDVWVTLGESPTPPEGNPMLHGRGVIQGGTLFNHATVRADWDGDVLICFLDTFYNVGVIESRKVTESGNGFPFCSLDFCTIYQTGGCIASHNGGQFGVTDIKVFGGMMHNINANIFNGGKGTEFYGATIHGGSLRGDSFDPAALTFFGNVELNGATLEDLQVFLNGVPIMTLQDAVILRNIIMRVFGQTSIQPGTTRATLNGDNLTTEKGDTDAWINVNDIDLTLDGQTNTFGVSFLTTGDIATVGSGDMFLDANVSAEDISIVRGLTVGGTSLESGGGRGGGLTVTVNGDFTFATTDESVWDWDAQAALAMSGGVGAASDDWVNWAHLEIGGSDLGTDPDTHTGDPAAFDDNFDLSILRIGEGAQVVLQDLIDNGNRGGIAGDPEALYVDTLEFADGVGQLNLNGLHLYFSAIVGDPGQIIDEPVAACDSDLIGDTVVNVLDLLVMLGAWGPNPGHAADLNGDDVVNVLDLLIMLGAWGPC